MCCRCYRHHRHARQVPRGRPSNVFHDWSLPRILRWAAVSISASSLMAWQRTVPESAKVVKYISRLCFGPCLYTRYRPPSTTVRPQCVHVTDKALFPCNWHRNLATCPVPIRQSFNSSTKERKLVSSESEETSNEHTELVSDNSEISSMALKEQILVVWFNAIEQCPNGNSSYSVLKIKNNPDRKTRQLLRAESSYGNGLAHTESAWPALALPPWLKMRSGVSAMAYQPKFNHFKRTTYLRYRIASWCSPVVVWLIAGPSIAFCLVDKQSRCNKIVW